jgi:hypothetical protein
MPHAPQSGVPALLNSPNFTALFGLFVIVFLRVQLSDGVGRRGQLFFASLDRKSYDLWITLAFAGA